MNIEKTYEAFENASKNPNNSNRDNDIIWLVMSALEKELG